MSDLVVFALISVVLFAIAELRLRFAVRRIVARGRKRVQEVLGALASGSDDVDAVLVRRALSSAIPMVAATVVRRDEAGKWHLTDVGKGIVGAGLQAIGEVVRKRAPSIAAGGIDVGGMDVGQALGAVLPKELRPFAGHIARAIGPFLERILGGSSSSPELTADNPFLKEVR